MSIFEGVLNHCAEAPDSMNPFLLAETDRMTPALELRSTPPEVYAYRGEEEEGISFLEYCVKTIANILLKSPESVLLHVIDYDEMLCRLQEDVTTCKLHLCSTFEAYGCQYPSVILVVNFDYEVYTDYVLMAMSRATAALYVIADETQFRLLTKFFTARAMR